MTDRLCANDVNKNACKFDSGGPLVFEDFKVGWRANDLYLHDLGQ